MRRATGTGCIDGMRRFPRPSSAPTHGTLPASRVRSGGAAPSSGRSAAGRAAVAVVLAVALTGTGLAAAGPAAAALKRPREYRASLVVTGGITTKIRRDTTTQCAPGQEWLYVTRGELEVRRTVTIHAFGSVVGAVPRRGPSGGEHTATISAYRETNRCPPSSPEKLEKPSCDSYPIPSVLAGLSTTDRGRAVLAISRGGNGPAHEPGPCLPPSILSPDRFSGFSTLGQPGDGILLPLSSRPSAFYALGRKKKLINRIRVTGTCDRVKVGRGAVQAPLDPLEDGDCVVDGTFNVEIKRLG